MLLLQTLLLLIYLSALNASVLNDKIKNIKGILALLRRSVDDYIDNEIKIKSSYIRSFQETDNNTLKVLNELNIFHEDPKKINITRSIFPSETNTKLPSLRRRVRSPAKYRRQYIYSELSSHDSERESSTSMEMQQWKEDFDIDRLNAKMSAIKEKTALNRSQGLMVNIAAARPWTLPCGDPNQHDLPWGTCTMPIECEGEFRIYRGDPICGTRSQFVCCALQLTQHDMYQALDLSFVETSASTSLEEKRKRKRGSRETERKKKMRQVNRIKKTRFRRKQQIKMKIRKLARQIRKELNRAFRNATSDRRKKTKSLKRIIKRMKYKFMMDRKAAKNVLDADVKQIDHTLHDTLSHVKDFNHNFLMNDTFRNVINGLYIQKDPDPEPINYNQNKTEDHSSEPENDVRSQTQTLKPLRRSGGGVIRRTKKKKTKTRKDYLEYDIEYGALYF